MQQPPADQPIRAVPDIAPAPPLDSRAILGLLAHRYPFLLVDAVEVPEPGRRVVGRKQVTGAEWSGHGPQGGVVLGTRPGMSGLLVVEALAQTSAALLLGLLEGAGDVVGYFVGMERIRLRALARPGETLRLTVTLRSFRRGIAKLRGVADVDGRRVASADFTTIVRPRI